MYVTIKKKSCTFGFRQILKTCRIDPLAKLYRLLCSRVHAQQRNRDKNKTNK